MPQPNKKLVVFIREAREKGYSDFQIRHMLLDYKWPLEKIEVAFGSLKPRFEHKNRVCIFLDSDLLAVLDKRAGKNMFTLSEQIEDILRRSCLNIKKGTSRKVKIDDTLVHIFSRERRTKKKKKKKVKKVRKKKKK